jgi:hypothetical protein
MGERVKETNKEVNRIKLQYIMGEIPCHTETPSNNEYTFKK